MRKVSIALKCGLSQYLASPPQGFSVVRNMSSADHFDVCNKLNFVGGSLLTGSGQTIDVKEPATGRTLVELCVSTSNDVEHAVQDSAKAYDTWSQLSGTERGRHLIALGHAVRKNRQEIAHKEVRDTGKAVSEALVDVDSSADCLEYYGGLAAGLAGQHFQLPAGNFAYTRREPLGVIGAIGAWNFPFQTCAWKIAPALAAGNTVVYKPSPLAPLSASHLAELATAVGFPAGVFNVVQGDAATGTALVCHERVAKVSFTGSCPTGAAIMEKCAAQIKPVTLELGGKSPLIIFEDAHLENAVNGALLANYLTQGEVCSNGARVYVHTSLMDDFLRACKARVEAMRLGDPLLEETHMGAMICQQHADKVMGYVERAVADGATVVCGGGRHEPSEDYLHGGHYIQPTILTDVDDSMEIVREEVFGPVMCVIPFTQEDAVVELANRTPYGLAAGVYTKDIQRGHRVVARLQAGTCFLNTYNMYPVEIPFGGYKRSGIGRENGPDALLQFTQVKSVFVEMGDTPSPGF